MSSRSRFKSTFSVSDKGEIVEHGYLYKRGQFNKNWKKRWFVLYDNNYLVYYENPENTHETALGHIVLYNVTKMEKNGNGNNKNDGFMFQLFVSKRIFSLKCDDENKYKNWMNKLNVILNPNILCKGWATKKGANNNSWKSRYFVLVQYSGNDEIRYYEDEQSKKFKGVINVSKIYKIDIMSSQTSIQKYGNGKDKILVLFTFKRIYVLNFNDTESRNMWNESIKKILSAIANKHADDIDAKNDENGDDESDTKSNKKREKNVSLKFSDTILEPNESHFAAVAQDNKNNDEEEESKHIESNDNDDTIGMSHHMIEDEEHHFHAPARNIVFTSAEHTNTGGMDHPTT